MPKNETTDKPKASEFESGKAVTTKSFVFDIIGTSRRVELPAFAVLRLVPETTIAIVEAPPEHNGVQVRITPEAKKTCVDHDRYSRVQDLKSGVKKCLDKIQDFENLPVLESGNPLRVFRDLGPIQEWCLPDNERDYLHHVNISISHPSLSVEPARVENNRHLVLVLTHNW